mmetsp:Transcript_13645/g.43092  ORF Transcript_13645/g.43092 Transcript_13645/m.43092 type:complete len:226 (-) Transcript_13645:1433-2110(-)
MVAAAARTSEVLKVAVVLGSTRTQGPPYPANVGARVGAFLTQALQARGHSVDLVDPIEEALPLLEKPHFAYGSAPPRLQALAERLQTAEAYCMVTPEYNHCASPALLNLLNHFGSSTFGFKPSLIVSYSQGQWGGTRAAHSLRPVLSEVGCLPVSAMIHVPRAHAALDDAGAPAEDSWFAYADRGLSQLEWWATAARDHKRKVDPTRASPPLRTSPAQRNAPGVS